MTQHTKPDEEIVTIKGEDMFQEAFDETRQTLKEQMGEPVAGVFAEALKKGEDSLVIISPRIIDHHDTWTVRYYVRSKDDGDVHVGTVALGKNAGHFIDNPAGQAIFPIAMLMNAKEDGSIYDFEAEAAREAIVYHAPKHFKEVVVAETQPEFFELGVTLIGGERAQTLYDEANAEMERRRAARLAQTEVEGHA